MKGNCMKSYAVKYLAMEFMKLAMFFVLFALLGNLGFSVLGAEGFTSMSNRLSE